MDRSCLSKEDDQRSGGRQIRGMVCEEELQEKHSGLWVREGRSSRGKVRSASEEDVADIWNIEIFVL